jgi:cystathionine gamma-synthase
MHPETLAVHAGRDVESGTGAVTPSITLSTTFERAADGSFPSGNVYTRSDNPNRHRLESALAALEGGSAAFAFASGMAATAAALHTLCAGDHVLMPDDLYHGTRHLAKHILGGRWGLGVEFLDMRDLDAVRTAVRPTTRLIWVETPSNPRLKVLDIAALADITHDAGAMCAVDNTWATPIQQRPLELGADIVMHSTTKYIGGHSDVLGGALIVRERGELAAKLHEIQELEGSVPSPFDCWLLLRSIATLPLRVRTQTASAGRIAAYLHTHPKVETVHYPGLPSHPNHDVAARQMTGFGGMLSFEVRGGREAAFTLAAHLHIITRATSLGGVESLIEHRRSIEGADSPTPDGLLRLSVGLEHPDDLIDDLAAGLDCVR